MTLLDRYIAGRFAALLWKIMLSLVLLVILVDLLTHRQDNIIDYRVPPLVVAQYYLTFVPTILFEYHVAAIAVLIAGLMSLSRAAQDQEITAALAGGISIRRLTRWPVILALLLAGAAFGIQETLGVSATDTASGIEEKYFSRFSQDRRAGISWANLSGGWTCHILKFNRAALTGQDVYIHKMNSGAVQEIRAERIWWDRENRRWLLERGRWFTMDPGKEWEQQVSRITQIEAPFNEAPDQLFALDKPSATKNVIALRADLKRAAALNIPTGALRVDWHAKFARPALCFIMIFLAIPFAIRLRRGGAASGFGLSIAIGLGYLVLFYATMGLGHLGKLPPVLAAWLPNALFLAAGLILYRRTPT
jgi:lipopolysaccharide export system permease protein